MAEPRWLSRRVVLLIHAELLAEHGGAQGLPAGGGDLIELALAKPRNLLAYSPMADIAELAACYLVGFCRGHAFVDGNKRLALAATATFLILNDAPLKASEADAYEFVMGVAEGRYAETDAAAWIRTNL
jgi:death-on-curing protein